MKSKLKLSPVILAKRVGCLLLSGLFVGSIASAHHSGAQFDQKNIVNVEGVVTKVEWTNPHARIYLKAKDKQGADVDWEFELPSVNRLYRLGWTTKSLKAGDKVTVNGAVARGFPTVAWANNVLDATGKKMFVGKPGS